MKIWTRPLIEAEKKRIRSWLEKQADFPSTQKALLGEIRSASDSEKDAGSLRHYLLIYYSLALELQRKFLSMKEIEKLATLADAILRVRGLDSGKSRVAFLYSDLHIVLSQLFSRNGSQWRATWEQCLASNFGDRSRKTEAGIGYLALAGRVLRLGDTTAADEYLATAAKLGLRNEHQVQSGLKRLLILRLQHDFTAADTLDSELSGRLGLSVDEKKEIQWERYCRVAMIQQDPSEMVLSVRRGKSHHDLEFAQEAFLWSRAVSSLRWIKQFPTFRKLVYSSAIQVRSTQPLAATVRAIETIYDASLSLRSRLNIVGETLMLRNDLVSINHELLLLGTLNRWLSRVPAPDFQKVVANEYQALSQRVTGARSADALCIYRASGAAAERAAG